MSPYKFSYVFLLCLTLLFITSCKNKTKIVTVTETTTVVVERIDTVIVIQGDSTRDVKVLTPIELSTGFVHTVKNDLAKVVISFDAQSGELTTDLVVEDREVDVKMERTTTTTEKKRERSVVTEKPRQRGLWWKIPLLCLACFFIGYGVAIFRG
jgi:hypothetical protein